MPTGTISTTRSEHDGSECIKNLLNVLARPPYLLPKVHRCLQAKWAQKPYIFSSCMAFLHDIFLFMLNFLRQN